MWSWGAIPGIDASDIHRLPFLKRKGFVDEAEYRVIGFSPEPIPAIPVPLDMRAVRKITISPFVHPALVSSIRKIVSGLDGWRDLPVKHSRLTDSQTWQRAIAAFPRRHGVVYGEWLPNDDLRDMLADDD